MSNWGPISWTHPNEFESLIWHFMSNNGPWGNYLTCDVKLASDGVIWREMSNIHQATIIIWHGISNKWSTIWHFMSNWGPISWTHPNEFESHILLAGALGNPKLTNSQNSHKLNAGRTTRCEPDTPYQIAPSLTYAMGKIHNFRRSSTTPFKGAPIYCLLSFCILLLE